MKTPLWPPKRAKLLASVFGAAWAGMAGEKITAHGHPDARSISPVVL